MKKTYLTTPGGNPAKDQTVVHSSQGRTFYSYGTPIATIFDNGVVELYPDWNASQTTNKYRGQFLGEGVAETRKKIESGEYRLVEGNL